MKKNIILIIALITLFGLFLISLPAMAEKDDNSTRRMELIKSSQALMEEQNKTDIDNDSNKIGVIFTNYENSNNAINTGIRYSPLLATLGSRPVRFIGEAIYLSQDEEINIFMSLSFEVISKIYFGGGAEVTELDDYHGFIGWNLNKNLFVEARVITPKDSFDDAEVYPFAGLQIAF